MVQAKRPLRKIESEFVRTVVTMVTAAFSLVAALAWNTAITKIIEKYFKPGESVLSWILYAVLVTILAVLVGIYLGRLSSKVKEEEEKKEDEKQDNLHG